VAGKVEPKEIYVWGACDDDGNSWLFDKKPEKGALLWEHPSGHAIYAMQFQENNLFPKDKPQKFKLAPVDE